MTTSAMGDELERHVAILAESRDRAQLTASAVALARSGGRDETLALARVLRHAEFLNRLDDTADPSVDIDNLMSVFRALAEHPTPYSAVLCELIYRQQDFVDHPSRVNLLLGALAAARPTTAEGAEVFRSTSQEGYAEVNGPLLLRNESPLALQVFEEIIAGDWVASGPKIEILHRGLLPVRNRLPVLTAAAHLLDASLAPEVRVALIESLFDYKSRQWFGPAMTPPEPPSWESGDTEALQLVIQLADRVLATELPVALGQAVVATRDQVAAIVRARTGSA